MNQEKPLYADCINVQEYIDFLLKGVVYHPVNGDMHVYETRLQNSILNLVSHISSMSGHAFSGRDSIHDFECICGLASPSEGIILDYSYVTQAKSCDSSVIRNPIGMVINLKSYTITAPTDRVYAELSTIIERTCV